MSATENYGPRESPEASPAARFDVVAMSKCKGRHRVAMVTAYDAAFARLADQAGVDVVLVGDSVGMVVQGQSNTLAVTLEEMVYHTRSVCRGVTRAHVVADLPFMSYQVSAEEAVRSAGALVKLGGAEAVKLEGGLGFEESIRRIVRCGIPVMGHVGLTPQSVHAMGGFKVQGRDAVSAQRILDDARAVEAAGAYAIVLEGIPMELARAVTEAVAIPTIGIGAGPGCDGQVLVLHDILGLAGDFRPRFVKRYADLGAITIEALSAFAAEVRSGAFPEPAHAFRSSGRVAQPTGLETAPTGLEAAQTGVQGVDQAPSSREGGDCSSREAGDRVG